MRRKFRMMIIACLIFIFTGGGLFATGMPVIDISAITQAITEAVAAVQRWNQQLNQWKSEYDRLKAASEKISSGDFTSIVMGIGNLAGQMSGWADYAGLGRAEDWLGDVEDGSYSLLNMLGNSKLMIANFEILERKMQDNMERIKAQSRNSAELAGDTMFEGFSFSIKDMTNLLQNGGNAVISGAELWNDVMDLFNVTPKDLAEIYDNSLNKALEGAGYKDRADLQKKIAELESDILKAQAELMGMNSESSPAQYRDKQAEIEQMQKKLNGMNSLLAWANDMETEKAKLLEQQKEYNALQKDSEAVVTQKTKNEWGSQMEASFSKAANQAIMSGYISMYESVSGSVY